MEAKQQLCKFNLKPQTNQPIRSFRCNYRSQCNIVHRIRSDSLSEPDGCFQFRRRWFVAGMRGTQIVGWPQTLHVSVGRIHNSQRIFKREKNSF